MRDNNSGKAVCFEHFHCAVCNFHVPADRKAFDVQDLGAKTRCKQCRKARDTRNWLCKCNIVWHKCDRHKYSPELMRGSKANAVDGQKMPTLAKSRRAMPFDRSVNPKPKKKARIQGLCRDNPGKREFQPDETEDIIFTSKEVRAVKYPRHFARLCELRKYVFKQAG